MIIDAKAGKPSPHHSAQVLIYQYAIPRALPEYRGVEFRGQVIYPDGNVQIPASGVDGKFIDRLAPWSGGWHQRPRRGRYPVGQNAAGATSRQRTALRGWRGRPKVTKE